MAYERQQYNEQINITSQEQEQVDNQLHNSSVKANEVVVVSALIEEKARLNEQRVALKKNCKEEKARLEQELEKAKARRAKIEEDEQNA